MQKISKGTLNLLFISFIFFGVAFTVIDSLIPLISKKLSTSSRMIQDMLNMSTFS